ncbi:hypothetical protein PPL_02512 [Heterostelium album PN500]|uniref:Serine protease n=1 Tax=Heterostelium pallidum (strain ATCC 26659 / Pp 5 / PN500) TaxID=670386 RepID=D3B2A3_HETP5|nr:hypothetical protein PPL_02512 [Heterostelium album PN500]EFA84478.1 hypothetical protein PPL_02512 [Heterostelium album PN500]|eukprot:XP_020436592.1 hypothetical protein PPL_02512 [Heterostelium album PN500]
MTKTIETLEQERDDISISLNIKDGEFSKDDGVINNRSQAESKDVRIFNSRLEVPPPNLEYKQHYESACKAVGRIIVRLSKEDEKDEWKYGTGFCVKKDIIITAAHVLQNPKSKNISIYIYFGNDAHIEREIAMCGIDNTRGVFRLKSCGREFDNQFKEPLLIPGVDKSQDKQYNWFINNDLEVLRFENNNSPIKQGYLFPMIPSGPTASKVHYVMGYPGYADLDTFIRKLSGVDNKINKNIYNFYSAYRGFQRKTICIGKVTGSNEKVLTHQCPTLPGTSGGVLANSEFKDQFIGIHLGSNTLTGNIALTLFKIFTRTTTKTTTKSTTTPTTTTTAESSTTNNNKLIIEAVCDLITTTTVIGVQKPQN